MIELKNYINGRLVSSPGFLEDVEPATGQVFAQVPRTQKDAVQLAVEAAQAAFPSWSGLTAAERSDYLLQIADGIEARFDEFVVAESQDNGKPLSLARQVDIPRAISNLRFFATAILHTHSDFYQQDHLAVNMTVRQPIGTVGCISPWNLPLYLFTWKIAPALATGNCVIAKPSEITPYSAYLLSEVCEEIGLPPGVLNILHGYGHEVGQAIVAHPAIKAISFTGGTATGKHIAATAAPMFKKLSLELGGKNPTIIFEDCDWERMMRNTLKSSFANNGQICLCGSRILVESSIYDRFVNEFTARVQQELIVGDPNDSSTTQGALVSEAHLEKVLGHLQTATAEGGTILTGGHRVKLSGRCTDGYFLAPTVITGLDQSCRTNTEEIFGPVVTIQAFGSEEEAVAKANATKYGLACSIWTNDVQRTMRVAHQVDAGIIWSNCWMVRDLRTPFGGMKQSGVGREGGDEALRFFTEPKNICLKMR